MNIKLFSSSEESDIVSRQFVCAGKAVFTVESKSGQYYTFRVTHKEGKGQYRPTWFVSLLTGPQNTEDYTYLGILDAATGRVVLTKQSRFNDDSTPVRVVRWALERIWNELPLPEGYSIHHEGCCGRCGRPLTTPSSIRTGIGPECAKKLM